MNQDSIGPLIKQMRDARSTPWAKVTVSDIQNGLQGIEPRTNLISLLKDDVEYSLKDLSQFPDVGTAISLGMRWMALLTAVGCSMNGGRKEHPVCEMIRDEHAKDPNATQLSIITGAVQRFKASGMKKCGKMPTQEYLEKNFKTIISRAHF